MLLSIDPGVHHHGCALWEDGELTAAWMTGRDNPLAKEVARYIPIEILTGIAIEFMQIYGSTGVKKGNDLLAVNFSAGRAVGEIQIQGFIEELTLYKPRDWKGQVPKDVMVRRIIKTLTPAERSRVELPSAESKQHNVWDGTGIGLKYWGRL